MLRRFLLAPIAALAACAGPAGSPYPQDAVIALDREPVVLPAAYLGTEQTESLQILNQGRHPLTVTSVRLAAPDGGTLGSSAFSQAVFSASLPAQVPGLSAGFIAFTFKPTSPGKVAARIVVESDAPARPRLEADVSACAVALDGGVDSGC